MREVVQKTVQPVTGHSSRPDTLLDDTDNDDCPHQARRVLADGEVQLDLPARGLHQLRGRAQVDSSVSGHDVVY